MPSASLSFSGIEKMVAVLGAHDESLRLLEKAYPDVRFQAQDQRLTLEGPQDRVDLVRRLVTELTGLVEAGHRLGPDTVRQLVDLMNRRALTGDTRPAPPGIVGPNILSSRGKNIRAKTANQQKYVDAIDANTVVFGLGPAGTGKTYLAMAKAVQALQGHEVTRIILTRPAVEAGEKLGFLPGTLTDKIDPYLRPLYDALHDMLEPEAIPKLMEAGTIEVAPLAYMRGRTLNDAFIILDEAQNTTAAQMKMFLTRLGFGSKIVVTGDTSQVDLPQGTSSGLRLVTRILQGIDGIHFSVLDSSDVVRHELVGRIVDAYERHDAAQAGPARKPQRKGRKKDTQE